ncbi:MAG: anti-sigma factor [Ginsengibacter sp.]
MELRDIISSGILELYSSGLTSAEENVQVHEWIKQFPELQNEIHQIQDAIEQYAFAHAVQPDPAVKQKILDRISYSSLEKVNASGISEYKKDKKREVYRIPIYFKWAAAASVILLIGSMILNYTWYNQMRSASANLQLVQNQLNEQKEIAEGMSKDMNVISDKHAFPVVLNGTPHAPDALAKIFWMKTTGDVYVDPTNLPQPSAGKQYQLWAIVDGKPVDAGMISAKKGIYKIQKMKAFGRAEAFAITLEKEGGSPTPTMEEMYVMAKIKI